MSWTQSLPVGETRDREVIRELLGRRRRGDVEVVEAVENLVFVVTKANAKCSRPDDPRNCLIANAIKRAIDLTEEDAEKFGLAVYYKDAYVPLINDAGMIELTHFIVKSDIQKLWDEYAEYALGALPKPVKLYAPTFSQTLERRRQMTRRARWEENNGLRKTKRNGTPKIKRVMTVRGGLYHNHSFEVAHD